MRFDFMAGKFSGPSINGHRLALIGTDRPLTWSQLHSEVSQLSERLLEHNPEAKPLVIHGHKEAGMVIGILACFHAKIPYVPVDNIVPEARLNSIAEIADASHVLNAATLELTPRAPSAKPWPRAADLAYIIFTSGSTGEPKGVQIQRGNVNDLADWATGPDFGFSDNDVVLNQCSFSFDVSFFDTLATLQTGGTLVLNSPNELKTPNAFLQRTGDLQATKWSSTPSFLSLALTLGHFNAKNFPSLKKFYVAGEAVHASLAERLWARFPEGELWNAYGPTEATVILTLVHVTRELAQKYPLIPIGKTKPGVTMPTTAPDETSEGELWIVGDNISPGYINRPDLNQTKFAMRNGKRAYLTGDLGYHQDGMVFCRGRIDSQIKLHGYRIELDEIDAVIGKMPGVEEVATVGLKRDGVVKKLVCFIKSPGGNAVVEAVRNELARQVPYYMVPADFKLVDSLPYNTNHKVDRGALAKQLE